MLRIIGSFNALFYCSCYSAVSFICSFTLFPGLRILSFSKSHSSIASLPRLFSLSFHLLALGCSHVSWTVLSCLIYSRPTVPCPLSDCLTLRQLHIKELGLKQRFEFGGITLHLLWLAGYCNWLLSFKQNLVNFFTRLGLYFSTPPSLINLKCFPFLPRLLKYRVWCPVYWTGALRAVISTLNDAGHWCPAVLIVRSVTILSLQWLFHLFTAA